MVIFFWVCSAALIIGLFIIWKNKNNLQLHTLINPLIIILCIPSVLLILKWHGDLSSKEFIKFHNRSNQNLFLSLHKQTDSIAIGSLDAENSKIFIYKPFVSVWKDPIYNAPDTLLIKIKTPKEHLIQDFPVRSWGGAHHLLIDKELKVKLND